MNETNEKKKKRKAGKSELFCHFVFLMHSFRNLRPPLSPPRESCDEKRHDDVVTTSYPGFRTRHGEPEEKMTCSLGVVDLFHPLTGHLLLQFGYILSSTPSKMISDLSSSSPFALLLIDAVLLCAVARTCNKRPTVPWFYCCLQYLPKGLLYFHHTTFLEHFLSAFLISSRF